MANNEMVAGQNIRLRARNLKNLVGQTMAQADVSTIFVSVFDEAWATEILTDSPMVYNATLADWGYVWNSPGPDGALYNVRVRVVATDGSDFTRDRTLLLQTDRGA